MYHQILQIRAVVDVEIEDIKKIRQYIRNIR